MTSNPKRTASDRSPYEKGKEEKDGRAYKMTRNTTNTDKTSKEGPGKMIRNIKRTMENHGTKHMIKYNYSDLDHYLPIMIQRSDKKARPLRGVQSH